MGTLGNPHGTFRLDDPDHWIGSYLRRQDLPEILGVGDDALADLPFVKTEEGEVVDENKVHRALGEGRIPGALPPGSRKISLNELVLTAVLRRTFPDCEIQRQVKVKNPRTGRANTVDLRLDVPGQEPILIEYDGPSHFIRQYRAEIPHPLARKTELEPSAGMEIVIWPYWMHICSASAQALFDPTVHGVPALWSSNKFFGDFATPDAACVIEEITGRFNAVGEEGYGTVYEAGVDGMHKPAHPIIESILDGRAAKETLVPNGAENPNRWLPISVRDS